MLQKERRRLTDSIASHSNDVTKHLEPGLPTPTIVHIAADRTFTFETRSESAVDAVVRV